MNVRLALTSVVLGVLAAFLVVIAIAAIVGVAPVEIPFFVVLFAVAYGWYHKNRIAKTLGRKYASQSR